MRLIEHLLNPSPSLQALFDALPDSPITATAQPDDCPADPVSRLGNGAVKRAVIKALAALDRPVHLAEVQEAVEKLLNQPVSMGSINCCLSTGSRGSKPLFERVSRGCYRTRQVYVSPQVGKAPRP